MGFIGFIGLIGFIGVIGFIGLRGFMFRAYRVYRGFGEKTYLLLAPFLWVRSMVPSKRHGKLRVWGLGLWFGADLRTPKVAFIKTHRFPLSMPKVRRPYWLRPTVEDVGF